eukprot:scaffold243405_cov17-Prasinocladus_malaysianus.AAC.1
MLHHILKPHCLALMLDGMVGLKTASGYVIYLNNDTMYLQCMVIVHCLKRTCQDNWRRNVTLKKDLPKLLGSCVCRRDASRSQKVNMAAVTRSGQRLKKRAAICPVSRPSKLSCIDQ